MPGKQRIVVPAPAPLTVPSNQIIVTDANFEDTLGGEIDSTALYLLDGDVNCGGVSIEVPENGVFVGGLHPELSSLTCDSDGFTMFTSPVGGSGGVYMEDMKVSVSGVGSQVYDLADIDGRHVVENRQVRFEDCSSRGTLEGYGQGVEKEVVLVGGKPELTLDGDWSLGYSVTDSQALGMDDGAYSLFKAAPGFTMATRFLTDIACDLPASASLISVPVGAFRADAFGNPAVLQIQDAVVSRNGVIDPSDPNLTPGLDQSTIVCKWTANLGLANTFEGGRQYVAAEVPTVIGAIGTFETLVATWGSSNMEHFDSPAPGQLRHLSTFPREYRVSNNFVMDSGANDQLAIRLRKWDDSAAVFVDGMAVVRQVSQLAGARDVATFNFVGFITLAQNDYVFWQTANNTSTTSVNLELDSDWFLEAR